MWPNLYHNVFWICLIMRKPETEKIAFIARDAWGTASGLHA